MHPEILNADQQSALAVLSEVPAVRSFYLAGGTALALRLGHRDSVDFDFFRSTGFTPQEFAEHLPSSPPVHMLQAERDTLTVMFRGVKTSFFGYPHDLIRPTITGPCDMAVATVVSGA